MELKQRQIINTAIDIFAEKGFQQTTMQEIAETAGVGKGTIYRFYASKEDLLSSLVEFAIQDVSEEIRRAIKAVKQPIQKLKTIIDVEFNYYDTHRNLAKFLVREVLGYGRTIEEHIKRIHSTRSAIVEPVVKEGIVAGDFKPVNPATLAASIEGMILSTVIFWFLLEQTHSREEIQHDIYTTIFDGLLVDD